MNTDDYEYERLIELGIPEAEALEFVSTWNECEAGVDTFSNDAMSCMLKIIDRLLRRQSDLAAAVDNTLKQVLVPSHGPLNAAERACVDVAAIVLPYRSPKCPACGHSEAEHSRQNKRGRGGCGYPGCRCRRHFDQ